MIIGGVLRMNFLTRKASRDDLEKIVRKFPQAEMLLSLPEQPIQVVDSCGDIAGILTGFLCSDLTMATNGLDHQMVMRLAEPISPDKIMNVHVPVIYVDKKYRDTKAFPLLLDGFKRLLQSLIEENGMRLRYVTATPGNATETTVFMALGLQPYGNGTFLAADAKDFLGLRVTA